MIKFFRKIRQNLLSEGKTGKYLKYAIGEIVLVVIGILIALQINNWNENRKDRLKEKELEMALLSDFQETKTRLQETIKKQQQAIDYARLVIINFESNQLLNIKDSLPTFTTWGFGSWFRAETVTKTYQSMISTGNIDLLTNSELKQKLAEFHAELDSGFEDQEESTRLLDALNKQLASFGFILKTNKIRQKLGFNLLDDSVLKNSVSDEDVMKLQSDHSIFDLATRRIGLEINRLESQQKMAGLVDEILLILNKHD
ncbi:DUF6090 family protein [Aestuariivivens sediminicola]|uniref:DUF6090 family protein n=1 Tax=Aestuariivivens sediminicola TaxID=2913560 RepID=UPI001F5A941F|nr:DUF6090 family protein [Aestuariivivens sediminicola]